MLRSILLATAFAGLLAGCVFPGTTTAPTAYPADYLPTVIQLTAASIGATNSAAVTPSAMPTKEATAVPLTDAPTSTPTPAPGIPLAAIQINAPGPMSRVVSPLELHLIAVAGSSNKIEVDLYGEDGRLLGRSLKAVVGSPQGDSLALKMPFQIRAAGENGTVQVSTRDASGRLQSLTTLQVLLLSSGTSQINPAGNAIYERVTFYHLAPDATVDGGVVSLDGNFLPYNKQPVILELVSAAGKSLGLRVLTFPDLDTQDFKTTIPYKVSTATPARLFVRQQDDVLNGPVYVYSQEITLNP